MGDTSTNKAIIKKGQGHIIDCSNAENRCPLAQLKGVIIPI